MTDGSSFEDRLRHKVDKVDASLQRQKAAEEAEKQAAEEARRKAEETRNAALGEVNRVGQRFMQEVLTPVLESVRTAIPGGALVGPDTSEITYTTIPHIDHTIAYEFTGRVPAGITASLLCMPDSVKLNVEIVPEKSGQSSREFDHEMSAGTFIHDYDDLTAWFENLMVNEIDGFQKIARTHYPDTSVKYGNDT